MGSYAGSRFGQDGPARISTSTEMLLEATEMPPVPTYQPLVPFYPSLVNGDGSTSSAAASLGTSGDTAKWKVYPDRLDLYVYQGDDVRVTLYFQFPGEPELDMSTFDWWAQIRVPHRYQAPLVQDFSVLATFTPDNLDDPTDPTSAVTKVDLFLPRQSNDQAGLYQWELAAKGPYDWSLFPKPDDLPDDAVWPPVDLIKTWMYGYLYVVPRLTTTDFLPLPPGAVTTGGTVVVTSTGMTVGPNGRVPRWLSSSSHLSRSLLPRLRLDRSTSSLRPGCRGCPGLQVWAARLDGTDQKVQQAHRGRQAR